MLPRRVPVQVREVDVPVGVGVEAEQRRGPLMTMMYGSAIRPTMISACRTARIRAGPSAATRLEPGGQDDVLGAAEATGA